jgi:acyl-CoA thioesterase-1
VKTLARIAVGTATLLVAASALPLPSQGQTPKPQPEALFIGDSYSEGEWAKPLSDGFTYLVANYFGWQGHNYAARATGYLRGDAPNSTPKIRGCTARGCPDYLQQLDQARAAGVQPRIILVSGGRNDGRSPKLEGAINTFYNQLRATYPHAQIFATSPIWYGSAVPSRLRNIKQFVANAAASVGATYIDLGEPLLGHPELMSADAVHPNSAGHAALAAIIETRITLFEAIHGND